MSNQLSRRELLKAGAMGALSLGAVSSVFGASHPAKHSSALRLGIASYTFRNFSRAQMIGFFKELRVTSLNAKDVKDHLPSDPQQEQAAVAEYRAAGIELHSAGAIYFKNEDADMRTKFEYCKRAGIPVMVVGDPVLESLPRIEQFARQYDIRIAIHNHGPEDKIFPSPTEVLAAVKHLDARMGCCIDVGHTARAGIDVIAAIRAAGPRLFNVHMKDLTDFRDKESQVAVGDGRMPVRAIFEALLAIKYQGFVDLEYEIHPDDPMPGVVSSMAYMRGILDGIA